IDKHLSRSSVKRLSENSLLWLVVMGGGVGAIAGQRLFRHKTKKQPFKRRMWAIIIFQIATFLAALLLWSRY
ncbi:MAG: DUF1294 domain-containing protein, partial [Pseudomonadota bacterium]